MGDFRRADRVVYSIPELVMPCIVERIMGNTSGRQHDLDKHEEAFIDNMRRLSGGGMERLPHSDTIKYFLEREPPERLAAVLREMVRGLVRKKRLYGMRFQTAGGSSVFRVALDAVHYFTSLAPLEHSTHRTRSDGRTEYMLTALVLSLVSPDGVRLPFMAEFIENPDGEYVKQDCELKAAGRLLARLADAFPKLHVMLLMDGLYLCGDIIETCRRNGWDFSVTVTDHVPAFKAKAEDALKHRGCHAEGGDGKTGLRRKVRWCNKVEHTFGGTKASLNVMKMETCNSEGDDVVLFYATSVFLHREEEKALRVLDEACRARWQIEESFLVQKHHGLELEAPVGTRKFAGQNYFLVVQIADVIRTFMLHTDLFRKLQRHASPDRIKEVIHRPMLEWYGTLGNLVRRLNRAMLTRRMGTEDISKWRLYYDTA